MQKRCSKCGLVLTEAQARANHCPRCWNERIKKCNGMNIQKERE